MAHVFVGTYKVLIDETDLEFCRSWQWHTHRTKTRLYVRGYPKGMPRAAVSLSYMHRILMMAAPSDEIDHRNGNGLDNRRGNLRFCTRSQNNANRYVVQGRSSIYKGVYFDRPSGRWRAAITKDGRRYNLGRWNSEAEAAKAYDERARDLFPEFGHGSSISKWGRSLKA